MGTPEFGGGVEGVEEGEGAIKLPASDTFSQH